MTDISIVESKRKTNDEQSMQIATLTVRKQQISHKYINITNAYIHTYTILFIPQQIIDLILFMYSKPIIINATYQNTIKSILYCPLSGTWNFVCKQLKHEYNIKYLFSLIYNGIVINNTNWDSHRWDERQLFEVNGNYVWLCHLDSESGDVFYERISDGHVQWNRPTGKIKPHWLAHKDMTSGELYFENIDDGATTWDRPDEFTDPEEKWIARTDGKSGGHYYEHPETQQTQWNAPSCFKKEEPKQKWLKHFDPTSGEYYYENLKTGDTTWDAPTGVHFD